VAIPTEDFVTRGELLLDLEQVVERIVVEALQDQGAVEDAGNRDDVIFQVVVPTEQTLECQGGLYMLGPGPFDARWVPLQATLWLSEDLNSVCAYEVRIAATISEGVVVPSTPEAPQDWLILSSTG